MSGGGGGSGATGGGGPVWEGPMYHTGHMVPLPPPPVNRQSDTTENITYP